MPTQATNTSSGNWRARYKSEFYDLRGRNWRVELIDSDTATGNVDFGIGTSTILDTELTSDGFNLSWDGPTDHVGGSLIPSKCEVTWIVTGSQMENLKTAIKKANDSRLGIALYYDDGGTHWRPYWVGVLNHEAIVYETQDRPYLITLVANCGLNRLSSVEFRNSGSVYTDDVSIAEVFARCINKIPTANFWNDTETQMSEVVDLYTKDHSTPAGWATSEGDAYPISVIERTVVNALTFSDGGDVDEDEYGRRIKQPPHFNSCKKVLENIANAFGARITLARFSFWFFPANALNWNHTLRVQKWTRTQVSSETIQTVLTEGNGPNIDTSTTEDVNFRHDIDANHALGIGWSNTYLLPIKRCTLTFDDAGTRSILGPPRNFYLDYPNTGGGSKTFANPDIVVSEGDLFTVSGTYSTDLIREFGNAITGTAFDDYGSTRIGARILLRFKIKINSASGTPYYYGGEMSGTDQYFTNIDMPVGFEGDITNPQQSFYRLILDSPSWSTEEKFYDIIVPWTSSTPAGESQSSGGWTRVGGLHMATHNDQFKYRINDTQWEDVLHSFEFVCLPLPDNLSSYSGVEVTVDRIVVGRTGVQYTTFPELDNILQTVAIVQYDHTGADTSPTWHNAPEDRVDGFRVILGTSGDDASWDMFVEQTENTEYLDCGTTTVGSNYSSGGAGSDGAVRMIEHGGSVVAPFISSSSEWNSITDEIDDLEDDTDLQFAMLREQLYQRGKALYAQRGDIVPQVSTSTNNTAPIDILSVIHHNCSSAGDIEDYLAPFRLSHVGSESRYNVDAWLLGRERLSFVSDEIKDDSKDDGGGTSGGGGVAPNGGISAPIGAGSVEHQSDIDTQKADANATDIIAVKTFVGTSLTSHPASGSKLMILGSDGVLAQLADGTSGQVLSTDGSGTFTFVDNRAPTSQTTTPTGAVDDDTPTQGATVTWTATNYDGVTTYIPVLTLTSNGSTVLSGTDFTQNGAVVTFTMPSNTNTHTLSITAVSAGKSESDAWTDSITAVANVSTWSYLRMQVVNTTSGANSSKPIKVIEVALYTGTSQSGTDNPTTDATGSNQNSSGNSDFVISHGYQYQISQSDGHSWRAFDGSTSSGWSTYDIDRFDQDDNWCQIEFTTAKAIESGRIVIDASNTTAPCDLKIMVSNTGAFSGEETVLTTLQDVGTGSGNVTHDWTN